MTKDELNEILKDNGMQLAKFRDGTGFKAFNVTDGENGLLAKYTGIGFVWNSDCTFSQHVVKALAEYANTTIEERQPKPQLYNIIIAKEDCDGEQCYTTWRKSEVRGFMTNDSTGQEELDSEEYQFTQDEIDSLKSGLPENQREIVDLGVIKVLSGEEKVVPF